MLFVPCVEVDERDVRIVVKVTVCHVGRTLGSAGIVNVWQSIMARFLIAEA